jgi:hypothetical protein
MRPTGWAQAPLSILITAVVGSLPHPLTAFDQHPPAATQQPASAAGRQQASPAPAGAKGAPKDGGKEGSEKGAAEGAEKATSPASLQDVARRISTVLAEQSGRPVPSEPGPAAGGGSSHGASLAAGGDSGAPRPRSRPSSPTFVAPKPPLVTLKWDPALTSGGVALSWDSQLDPRRAGAGDLGIRLVWSASLPGK